MKKILAGIVVILLAAGLGAPFVNGLLVERQIRETFDKINKMYGDTGLGITVEITRYDRGFSSSEMEWKVNFGKMAALYGMKEWLFLNRMKHELTGVVAETTLTKNPVYTDFINQKLAGKDPLHLTTRYSLTGTFETTATLDAFSITEEGETVQVKPGRIHATSDKHLKHFFYEGTWDGLQVNDLATMEGFSIKSDLEMASLYLWDGYATFAIKGGRVEDANAPFSFSNLKMDCTSKYDKERNILSGKVEYGADSLIVGREKGREPFCALSRKRIECQGVRGVHAAVYGRHQQGHGECCRHHRRSRPDGKGPRTADGAGWDAAHGLSGKTADQGVGVSDFRPSFQACRG